MFSKNIKIKKTLQDSNTLFILSGPDLQKRSPGTHFKIRRRWLGQLKHTQRSVQLAYQPASQHRFSFAPNQYQQPSVSSQLAVFFF